MSSAFDTLNDSHSQEHISIDNIKGIQATDRKLNNKRYFEKLGKMKIVVPQSLVKYKMHKVSKII